MFKSLRLLAPQSQPNRLTRLINQLDISFGEGLVRGFGRDRPQLMDLFDDADDVFRSGVSFNTSTCHIQLTANLILLQVSQVADADKVVFHLWHGFVVTLTCRQLNLAFGTDGRRTASISVSLSKLIS